MFRDTGRFMEERIVDETKIDLRREAVSVDESNTTVALY